MIYESAIDQVKDLKSENIVAFRLATVTSLSNGRAYVQFYGDSAASTKLYPYIEGYKPTVNDNVLMIAQGDTFIIAGKISKESITNNYYLKKNEADSTFLTEAQADAKYEPIGGGDEYKPVIKNSGHWFGYRNDNTNELTFGTSSSTPDPASLGNSSSLFAAGYFDTLGGTTSNSSIQQLNVKNSTIYGTSVTVNTTNSVNVGTSTKQLNNVYAKQFYQNGTAISTSDKRKKTGIKAITKKYITFFRNLRPALFKFKDGESGRTHCGFIAQEVEAAAHEAGIENKDLAFLCIDNEGNYGLRYEELIALQTQIIQDLLIRVENLEEGSKK